MKKIILALVFFSLALYISHSSYADEQINYPRKLELQPYHRKCISRNGRQFRESAIEEHDGNCAITLICNESATKIQSGTSVFATLGDERVSMLVSHTDLLESGEMLICLEWKEPLSLHRKKSYTVHLDFYSEDLTTVNYTADIKNVPFEDIAIIPQTGDFAVLYALIAIVCLIVMAFLLSPKSLKKLSGQG